MFKYFRLFAVDTVSHQSPCWYFNIWYEGLLLSKHTEIWFGFILSELIFERDVMMTSDSRYHWVSNILLRAWSCSVGVITFAPTFDSLPYFHLDLDGKNINLHWESFVQIMAYLHIDWIVEEFPLVPQHEYGADKLKNIIRKNRELDKTHTNWGALVTRPLKMSEAYVGETTTGRWCVPTSSYPPQTAFVEPLLILMHCWL